MDHTSGDALHDQFCWKLWIPQTLIQVVLENAHDHPLASHGGIHKTLERVRRYYYWPGMVKDVKTYILGCETCKATKAPNTIQRPPMGDYLDYLGQYPRSRSGHLGTFIVLDHY